jgi:hypothetical protein
MQRTMWYLAQVVFYLPDILCRETPIVFSQIIEITQTVTGDPTGVIDIGIEVTPRQISQSAEYWTPAMEANIARPANRSPAAVLSKNEDHMIEFVL